MKYDITTKAAPKMPNLGKGTECIKLLTGQTSKDMHEPVVPLLFPPLAAHVCGAEFQYPDNTWKEVCGIMANIVADSGDNKGQLTPLVEALCRDFRLHDKGVTDELVDWQRKSNANGGKDSTARPNIGLWFPPIDTTAAGFLLNSMALESEGRRVTLFPDSGCYDKWLRQMKQTTGIDFSISSHLESYPPNTDLGDLL
jgi:hypothetical protein